MSFADLSLARWRTFDLPTARATAEQAADQVGGRLIAVETFEHLGFELHRARIDRQGQEFALIPGGVTTLGFDVRAWEPTPEQSADFADSAEEGYGYGLDLRSYLTEVLSPRRTVTVPTVFMAVDSEPMEDSLTDFATELIGRGLRVPSADEWEHACGAGADTLFRWGNDCPLDRIPYNDADGPQNQLNAFGLRIAHDTYSMELTREGTEIRGGDGGESVCGGYGFLLGWLPLATANRNPFMAEYILGPEGEGIDGEFTIRPVIDL